MEDDMGVSGEAGLWFNLQMICKSRLLRGGTDTNCKAIMISHYICYIEHDLQLEAFCYYSCNVTCDILRHYIQFVAKQNWKTEYMETRKVYTDRSVFFKNK